MNRRAAAVAAVWAAGVVGVPLPGFLAVAHAGGWAAPMVFGAAIGAAVALCGVLAVLPRRAGAIADMALRLPPTEAWAIAILGLLAGTLAGIFVSGGTFALLAKGLGLR